MARAAADRQRVQARPRVRARRWVTRPGRGTAGPGQLPRDLPAVRISSDCPASAPLTAEQLGTRGSNAIPPSTPTAPSTWPTSASARLKTR